MKGIKGPAVFLAQFYRDESPFNSLEGLCSWMNKQGFIGIQIPTWEKNLFNLDLAASSQNYCDEIVGTVREAGMEIVDLGSYLQGQCMAYNQVYEIGFSAFHPQGLQGKDITKWATEELIKSIVAASKLGVKNISVMSGGLLWHMIYPWPQRPQNLVDEAFNELAIRWIPVLQKASELGVTIGYELHPGSDLFDGATFNLFLEKVKYIDSACITYDPSHFVLQYLDYIEFIQIFHQRIKAFHVKDAELNYNGLTGVYGGFQPWLQRAGRFRSLGDGQVDFKRIFSLLTENGFDGWAIMEWECCIKSPEQGAAEGAQFIRDRIIHTTDVAFDDFASIPPSKELNRKILGI